MNRTRHSRTYPWRRPLRWLWLALALAASGVMVVHMPAWARGAREKPAQP